MDDRRIARALLDDGVEAEERMRRRRARWRVFFRIIAIVCLISGVALVALLLRPLPTQAELQYTQGTIREARWSGTRWPRFEIALDHESRSFEVDQDLAERGGRNIADITRPGQTARIGYTNARRAWDLAINDRTIYSLSDIRARTARQAPPYWLGALTLLAVGVVGWFLTPRPRRRSYRDRLG
jgi:hypothetical protein